MLNIRFKNRRVYFLKIMGPPGAGEYMGGQRVCMQHIDILRSEGLDTYAVVDTGIVDNIVRRFMPFRDSRFMDYGAFLKGFDPEKDIIVIPGRFADKTDSFPGKNKIVFSQGAWITMSNISVSKDLVSREDIKGIIVVSAANKDLLSLVWPDEKIHVVQNRVDIPDSIVGYPDREDIILYPDLSRCEKNPLDTKSLINILKVRFADKKMQFIELKGMEHTEVLSLMGRSKALLFLGVHEGWGLAVGESLAHGCPAFGYDVRPVSDIIGPECVVSYGDIKRLSELVVSIIERPNVWGEISANAHNRALEWGRDKQKNTVINAWNNIFQGLENQSLRSL